MDYLIIRILSSLLAGLILSQTGSFIQLGTRNILASPSTLGFDGLSILWLLIFHSLMIFLGLNVHAYWLVLVGAPFFLLIAWPFSSLLREHLKFERVVLLGLTFNLFVGAVFSLWQFFFLAFNHPFPIELWFGHFRYASAEGLIILLIAELLILLGIRLFWKELKLYSLGPAVGKNFSLKRRQLFYFIFSLVGLGTFVVISLFGAFSFLALIFPLVARRFWFQKFDLSGEILMGAILNGLCLSLTDLVCYWFPILGAEIPVGLIATAIGAVSLILLLWRADSRELLAKVRK